MNMFCAEPSKIIANMALASVISGLPLGALMTVTAIIFSKEQSFSFTQIKDVFMGGFIAVFYIFMCGMMFIAPLLFLLSRIGWGGPFFVYSVSIVIGTSFLVNGLVAGIAACALTITASYVFCRLAYAESSSY